MRNLVKRQWGSKSNLGVYVGLVSAWTNKDDERSKKIPLVEKSHFLILLFPMKEKLKYII